MHTSESYARLSAIFKKCNAQSIMQIIFAQEIPPLWTLPFGLLTLFGVPICAVAALNLQFKMHKCDYGTVRATAWIIIIIPSICLIWYLFVAANRRAADNFTTLDDIKSNWYWLAIPVSSVVSGILAIFRQRRSPPSKQ